MPKKRYNVALSSEEEIFLKSITHAGSGYSAREVLHAQVLLHSNDNKPASKKDNREIAEWFDISPITVNQIRKSYSENGLKAALYRKTRIIPPVASKITGDFEEKVIATDINLSHTRQMSEQLKTCGYRIGRKKVRRYMNEMGIDPIYSKMNLSKRIQQPKVCLYLLRQSRKSYCHLNQSIFFCRNTKCYCFISPFPCLSITLVDITNLSFLCLLHIQMICNFILF